MQWEAWRREVTNKITSGVFNEQHCLQLAELLAGDNKALKLIYENCEVWYKYLICYLTYWEPSVLGYQLSDHARTAKSMYEADRALDKILFALFASDFFQVIYFSFLLILFTWESISGPLQRVVAEL